MRRRWMAAAAGLGLLGLTPMMAAAAPLTGADYGKPVAFYRFCAEAQLDVANIDVSAMNAADISIGGTIYDDWDDFVLSKSAVSIDDQKILVAQHTEYADAGRTLPKLIRCKLRTGESISEGAWPAGADNNGGRFTVDPFFGFGSAASGVSTSAVDQQCTAINERTVDNVWDSLSAGERAAAPYSPAGAEPTLTTLDDDVVGSGPMWTVETEPFALVDGVLGVKSLSLVAESNSAGVPRFEGAHYCSLVAPEYLTAVLLGDVEVEEL